MCEVLKPYDLTQNPNFFHLTSRFFPSHSNHQNAFLRLVLPQNNPSTLFKVPGPMRELELCLTELVTKYGK